MGKRTGKKNLSEVDKEEIRALVRDCEIMNFPEKTTLQYLKEKGFPIGATTLYAIKKEFREGLVERFEEIARYELAYEHLLAIDGIKELEQNAWKIIQDPNSTPSEKIRASSELRSVKFDLMSVYGSHEIVKNVMNAFEQKYPQSEKRALL